MALSGIQTLDPDNQGAAELRLRPHGHGVRFASLIPGQNLALFTQTLSRKEYIPPKCWYEITNLHGVKTHDNSIDFISC
jgi:hypothetical protein